MNSFPDAMEIFQRQLQEGILQEAYQGLMKYIKQLRVHFEKGYPAYSVASGIYSGYLDMTAFYLFPESLKKRKLKISIVFVYETFRFEVWLSGMNRDVQVKYWNLLRDSGWDRHPLASNPRKVDYITDHVLVDDPDWSSLDALTSEIEAGTVDFIRELEVFLEHAEI